MEKGRLEAFSDGVMAVIITIMVLDLKAPAGNGFGALAPQFPTFVAYVLSFVNVGIYWNNHHHLLHATRRIDGRTMWANMNLLFWLSLLPLTTAWAGAQHLEPVPTFVYGFDLLMCASAYFILQTAIVRCNGPESTVALALGADWKGKASFWSYAISLPIAFSAPVVSALMYACVAALWFVPDRRMERIETADEPNANAGEETSSDS